MNSLSLSELCTLIGEAITQRLPDTYWVRAEVAALSEKGGHLYLDLVEKGQRGLFVARQRAVCWSGVQQMLCAYFTQETGTHLQAGMQVLLEVAVRFHPTYGLSLEIRNIDPQYTMGDLARQRQETISRLQEEGVLEMQRMLTLPTLTQRLAVISSADAAGYEDFVHQLTLSGYRFHTVLFPATMQGERAERSMLAALNAVMAEEDRYDAVVIIRGGGATTDLTCFDSYSLCAHCAQFPLPILTGIGHTKDVSVLDMVAYCALKTPTAVAAFLIDGISAQAARVETLLQRLQQTASRQVLLRTHRVEQLQSRLQYAAVQRLSYEKNRIENLNHRVVLANPERIYRMGYTLLRSQGKVLRSVKDVREGDLVSAEWIDGNVEMKVETINHKHE